MNRDDHRERPFDLLEELARFGSEKKISLKNPQAVSQFASFVSDALTEALENPALLYGKTAEAMFEAMLVSLGDYSLLKAEDCGRVYPEGCFKIPDFRVVLRDGTQWLVEVKNINIGNPLRQDRRVMRRDYREKLENYASATGGHLKLAVFWAKWRLWTLVSPERLIDEEGDLTLDMRTALEENELVYLGDRMIGTRSPLRIRFVADPDKTRHIAPDGTARFTIGEVQVCCDEDVILDQTEKQLVWTFIAYGQWQESGPHPLWDGDQFTGIEFRWEPIEPTNQGFEPIGMLSQLFTSYYAEQTLDDGEVAQIRALPQPKWFEPLADYDYDGTTLPLWQFSMEPKSSGAKEPDVPSERHGAA